MLSNPVLKDELRTFFRYNTGLLLFGLVFSFFSSFGQTFLLSLYVPSIAALLGTGNTGVGTIYAVATIASALTLPWLGGYFDKTDIRRYSRMVVLGLALALLFMSFARHLVMVLIGFYGLRLFGQGLMSHTSMSAMAKYFNKNRGKAISIGALGFSGGEAVLPIVITVLIGAVGWRWALRLSAANCVLIILPLTAWLLKLSKQTIRLNRMETQSAGAGTSEQGVKHILFDKRFRVISPIVFMLGFTNTAIFFFQLKLGAARGWTPEWVAGSISVFAIAGATGMLGTGPMVDRFTGKRLFPYFLILYLAGLFLLIRYSQPWVYPAALILIGLANGSGNTIRDAMVAEIYGIDMIGRVRSIFITVMVASTALGPVTFGILLDMNLTFSTVFTAVFIAMLLSMLNGFRRL